MMGSPKVVTAGESESDQTFPVANVSEELNLGVPENFPVDPVSSDVAAVKEAEEAEELKKQVAATAKAKAKAEAEAEAEAEADKCSVGQTIMSTLLVSGVVLAAIGVGLVVTKKLRET